MRFLELAPRKHSRVADAAPEPDNPVVDGSLVPPSPAPHPVVVDVDLPSGVFRVDAIVGARGRKAARLYRVAWTGYGARNRTWEPLANLSSCEHLVKGFEDNHPQDLSNSVLTFTPDLDEIASIRSFKRGSSRVPPSVAVTLYCDGVDDDGRVFLLPFPLFPSGFLDCSRLWSAYPDILDRVREHLGPDSFTSPE